MKRIVLFFLSVSVLVSAQELVRIEDVQDRIISQMAIFPQEKVHLHTDRDMYIPGKKIWFRVYAVDAFSHRLPTNSRYAYVELIDSADSLMYRVTVTADGNGLLHGHLSLTEFIPAGDYTLRAYTRYMENLGDDYFFKKNIRIGSLRAMEKKTAG